MNSIFENLLRKFVIIFLDDMLVFITTIEEHMGHLNAIFQVLKRNKLLVKLSMCFFRQPSVGFLGHIISKGEVNPNSKKLKAMEYWTNSQEY